MIIDRKELTDLDFETLNIIYDIFIDDENYQNIDVKCNDRDILADFNELEDTNQHGLVIQKLRNYEKCSLKIDDKAISNHATTFWKHLFLAKKTRAILQSIGTNEASKLIDEIAEYLLSKLPDIYEQDFGIIKCKEEPQDFGQKKFLILFYNEISQCCSGYLNTGYAEKSLKYYPEEACHYELLGLYNKALGLSHHENKESRENALKHYDEIINTFKIKKEGEKYLGYGYDFDTDLWKMYVYLPAIYHKAEVLIKLQRGKESIDILNTFIKKYKNYNVPRFIFLSTEYKIIDSMILKVHAMLESSNLNVNEEIKNIEIMLETHKENYDIQRKYNFLIAKLNIEDTRENLSSKKNEEIYKFLKETIYNNLFKEERNEDERTQASFYWLEAFQLYIKASKNKNHEKGKDLLEDLLGTLIDILNYIFERLKQDPWIPNKEKILKLIVEIFEEINDDDSITNDDCRQKIKDIEIRYCHRLTHKENKPSSYQKVKSVRRLLLLGENNKEAEMDYNFPDRLEIVKDFANIIINKDYYTQCLRYNTEKFDKNLIYSSYWPQLTGRYAFTVLRKWQSFTPALGSYSTSSRGGGYFVYKVGDNGNIEDGVVVDPGYDFIENFIEHNFSIKDITAIAITHSHIDHSVDFRGLMTLIHEMNKRGVRKLYKWPPKKVTVILTPSCFDHFFQIISDSRDYIKDVIVVDPDRHNLVETELYEIGNEKIHFYLSAVPAYHKDLQENANCVGLILRDNNDNKIIGFTGDTVWTHSLYKRLKDCSVICANMGALIDVNKGDSFEKTFDQKDKEHKKIKKLIYKENHLYLPGIITLLDEIQKTSKTKITVVGELGEELKSGLRKDLFHKFNQFIDERTSNQYGGNYPYKWQREILYPYPLVAIEDINLTITWETQSAEPYIRCTRCKRIIPPDKVMLRVTNDDRKSEQLFYYCKECLELIESLESGVEREWEKRYLPPHQV
ncbi:MAG TPA: hypothetical protein DCK76_08455 [Desulfotomaculum sp.]|nr:MAG: Beta-lactamase domain protein [Desulfotomaculum sp. 46_80]HAG11393.1 hypothetical protein [Desulfotomaculum sp.]HBY05181.1 hypothetical protein [Desulfotomaculum sp.]